MNSGGRTATGRQSVMDTSGRVQKNSAKERSLAPVGAALPQWRTKSPPSKATTQPRRKRWAVDDDGDDDSALGDAGLATALLTDTVLRDVPQAVMYARNNMFSALPARGISSALTSTILSRRSSLPPLVSTSHLHAVLNSTPTTIERETAELLRMGTLRRIVVPGRGPIGELLILSTDLEHMLRNSAKGLVDEATCQDFAQFLRVNPAAGTVPAQTLRSSQVDSLVRAGFLTSPFSEQHSVDTAIFARPEDRASLLSLATVARAASGTVEAVGGHGRSREHAVSSGGAAAGAGNPSSPSAGDHRIAVPGAGAFLKLVAAALGYFTELLARMPNREAPADLLRDRWDGCRGRPTQGGRFRASPGQSHRWKEFSGLRFDWILAEAVGSGLVEVFETGCVGTGVRLL